MDRKRFISSALLTIGSLNAMLASLSANADDEKSTKIPPYLRKGDTIAITSLAGYISVIDCIDAINMMESWG